MIQAIKQNSRGVLEHWEKLLLLIAVLLLAGALMRFYRDTTARRSDSSRFLSELTNRPVHAIADVDLSPAQTVLIQAQNRSALVVTGRHNLFSPPGSARRQP